MDLQEKMHAELVRFLVQKNITCAVTGQVLDMRTCVVLVDTDGDPAVVVSQDGWRNLTQTKRDTLTTMGYTVDESTVKP